MDTVVKNIHLLKLADTKRDKLEQLAASHKKYSNIHFKIAKVNGGNVVVLATQGKDLSENYADKKTLIDLTRELFSPFVSGKVNVHTAIYKQHLIESVTPEWLKQEMEKYNLKIGHIARETNIDKANLSSWINGISPMSKPVKTMFFFYFHFRQMVIEIKPARIYVPFLDEYFKRGSQEQNHK